jgi:alpha-N-arabinofuranosidase
MRGDIVVLNAYNAKHKRDIGLCHTEYRANCFDPTVASKAVAGGADGLNVPTGEGDPNESIFNKECHWAYGLGVLSDFMDYQSMGGMFRFAIFTNTIDGWGENLINAGKDRVYLSAAGQSIAFLQRQPIAWPLATTLDKPDPTLKIEAAWDARKTTFTLIVLNLASQPRELTIDIAQLKGKFAPEAGLDQLTAASPKTFNSETNPDQIVRSAAMLKTDGKTITHTFAPYSATAIRLMPR